MLARYTNTHFSLTPPNPRGTIPRSPMLTGRLLLLLIVLSTTLATRQPAVASERVIAPAERTTWVQRLGSGVARTYSRIGLMQRVTLNVPTHRLAFATGHNTLPVERELPDPLRTCLPPPTV